MTGVTAMVGITHLGLGIRETDGGHDGATDEDRGELVHDCYSNVGGCPSDHDSGRISGRFEDGLKGGAGLIGDDFDRSRGGVGRDLGQRVRGLDRLGNASGATTAGHIPDVESHEKLLFLGLMPLQMGLPIVGRSRGKKTSK
jgi:hypothetical protein